MKQRITLAIVFSVLATALALAQGGRGQGAGQAPSTPPPPDPPRVAALKDEAIAEIDKLTEFTQQMVDQIFSYGELGFQEVETHRYLVNLLRAGVA